VFAASSESLDHNDAPTLMASGDRCAEQPFLGPEQRR
jgi:hypothetical protein